ncbi:hypothetical protein U1Q18_029378, partial [Sarracenia purpurea var. burkii]
LVFLCKDLRRFRATSHRDAVVFWLWRLGKSAQASFLAAIFGPVSNSAETKNQDFSSRGSGVDLVAIRWFFDEIYEQGEIRQRYPVKISCEASGELSCKHSEGNHVVFLGFLVKSDEEGSSALSHLGAVPDGALLDEAVQDLLELHSEDEVVLVPIVKLERVLQLSEAAIVVAFVSVESDAAAKSYELIEIDEVIVEIFLLPFASKRLNTFFTSSLS